MEAGVVLEAEHGRAEAHGDQEKLQGRVHLRADVWAMFDDVRYSEKVHSINFL